MIVLNILNLVALAAQSLIYLYFETAIPSGTLRNIDDMITIGPCRPTENVPTLTCRPF